MLRYALITLLPIVAASAQVTARDSGCKDLHVFLARGNNEPYPGRQGALVEAICSGLSSCDYEDIQYNNPFESLYCDAVAEGATNGVAQVTAYNKRCPDAKLVLSGYSQGAHVVGDVLGGGGGTFFQGCVQKTNLGLDPSTAPGNKIVAALTFGDVRHTAGQSYNVETGANGEGLFPRSGEQLAGLNRFSGVLRTYCVSTDPICAGGDKGPTHLSYFSIFSGAAGTWVKEKFGSTAGAGTSASAPSSSTPSVSSETGSSQTTALSTLASTESHSRSQNTAAKTSVPVIESSTSLNPTPTVTATSASPTTTTSAASTSSQANGVTSSWRALRWENLVFSFFIAFI